MKPKVRQKIVQELFEKQKGICYLCKLPMILIGNPYKRATLDHIVPLSKGGSNNISNLKAAHRLCNEIRGIDNVMDASYYVERSKGRKWKYQKT